MGSSSQSYRYDVFLSFRGVDTRKTFVSHLYRELKSKSITTFKDDRDLQPGDFLPDKLPEAIKESKFAVVIISENYASSGWCLDELAKIMELKKKEKLDVFPIFYVVDPSDVRKQKGTFEEAFRKHDIENPDMVDKWRKALTEIANSTGVVSHDWKEEADMVRDVAENILERLLKMLPEGTSDLIGMDTKFEELKPFLSMESDNEVLMIGIWGMGGTGKTTIARHVFEKLSCQFCFRCFIDDVKKIYGECGREKLRRQFLYQILKDESLQSESFYLNSNAIQERLSRKKVLAVLDDVDNLDQLEALAKQNSWFGPGTRIIITTRDEGLLLSRCKKHVYEVKCLEPNAAYSFFNHFAFGEAFSRGQVPDEKKGLAVRASNLCGGLPLALKVLGLYLRERKIGDWETEVQRLRDHPSEGVTECLKVSYNGLTKENQRIFLTVACLFNQERASHVSQIIEGEESRVRGCLNKLAEKALIGISDDDEKVIVHDLIHDMAKGIAEEMETDAIEGLSLNMRKMPYCFKDMQHLKYLKIRESLQPEIHTNINHLPPGLRLLEWFNCPLTTLPSTFRGESLVELRLSGSHIELLEGTLSVQNLRRLYLRLCHKLEEIPILNGATKLEELNLGFCGNLVKFSSSFSFLKNLTRLYVIHCQKLKFLPSIAGLKSLKVVNLRHCRCLMSFPELPEGIVELYMSETGIREVPESIRNLVALKVLDLSFCRQLSEISSGIGNLRSLKKLRLKGCPILKSLPDSIGNLTELEDLDLLVLSVIPSSIGNFQSVKELILRDCKEFRNIPDTVGNLTALEYLSLHKCDGLRNIPDTIGNLTALTTLSLSRCGMLSEVPSRIGDLTALKELSLHQCGELRNIPTTIGNLTALTTLSLSRCRMLSEVPSRIGDLTALKELSLHECSGLRNIPSTIGNLTALTTLNLSGCRMLSEVPSRIGDLTALKELSFHKCCRLRNIPSTIGNLTALTILNLSGCAMLSEIPSAIGDLTAMKELSFHKCCRLRNIPSTIGNLTALTTLSPSRCGMLSEVPSKIGDLTALKELSFHKCCRLRNIPSTIGNLTALTTLNLSGCAMLSEIPSAIGDLTALKTLKLDGCIRLSDIPIAVGKLTSLENLFPPEDVNCVFKIINLFCCVKQHINTSNIKEFLSFSWDKDVNCKGAPGSHAIEVLNLNLQLLRRYGVPSHCTSLSLFPQLRKLSLCYCNIQEISDDLGCLLALRSLDLSGNFCKVLPESVKQLSLLEELVLCWCKDLQIMPEIPQGVKYLYANGCRSLESVSNVSGHQFLRLMLNGCPTLGEDPQLFIRHMISMTFHKEEVNAWACFSASEVPDCFYHRRKGQNLTIYCPQADSNLKPVGFVAGVVFNCRYVWGISCPSIQCHWQGKGFQFGQILVDFKSLPSHASFCGSKEDILESSSSHAFLWGSEDGSEEDILIVFSYNFGEEKSCDRISFHFDLDPKKASGWGLKVKGCGIQLRFTEESQRTRTLCTLGGGSSREDILTRNRRYKFRELLIIR